MKNERNDLEQSTRQQKILKQNSIFNLLGSLEIEKKSL
jgi:hypothetical protein